MPISLSLQMPGSETVWHMRDMQVTRGNVPHYNVLHAAVYAEGKGGSKSMVQNSALPVLPKHGERQYCRGVLFVGSESRPRASKCATEIEHKLTCQNGEDWWTHPTNHPRDGRSALHLAYQTGSIQLIKLLHEAIPDWLAFEDGV